MEKIKLERNYKIDLVCDGFYDEVEDICVLLRIVPVFRRNESYAHFYANNLFDKFAIKSEKTEYTLPLQKSGTLYLNKMRKNLILWGKERFKNKIYSLNTHKERFNWILRYFNITMDEFLKIEKACDFCGDSDFREIVEKSSYKMIKNVYQVTLKTLEEELEKIVENSLNQGEHDFSDSYFYFDKNKLF